jgi:AcrR family transcriptional regulator
MNRLLSNLRISVPKSVYLKDPESSDLGKRIIEQSIQLIDEMGIEAFTFKKLGEAIGSNESSIYRYFENKHKLLIYLSSWYWSWIEYQVVIATFSLNDAQLKLDKAIEIVTREVTQDNTFTYVDEVALNRIMINENSKSFLTKQVDLENKEGNFESYKRLVTRLEEMIADVAPKYNGSASTLSGQSL